MNDRIDELNCIEFCGIYYPINSKAGQLIQNYNQLLNDYIHGTGKIDINKLSDRLFSLKASDNELYRKYKMWELCRNPLFKDTYWGQFASDCSLSDFTMALNRDELVEEYRIVAVVKSARKIYGPSFDHTEVYMCKDASVIYLVSPYTAQLTDIHYDLDMDQVRPVYGSNTVTFLRRFSSSRLYNGFIDEMSKHFNTK
jgi:hypothetical protein